MEATEQSKNQQSDTQEETAIIEELNSDAISPENAALIDAINESVKSEIEPFSFFGTEVIATECVAWRLFLRGKSKGAPPKLAEVSACTRFPDDSEIKAIVANVDDIEEKLKARKALRTGNTWFAECSFQYRKDRLTAEYSSIDIIVEICPDSNGASGGDAISFVREARQIAQETEDRYSNREIALISSHKAELANKDAFYRGEIAALHTHYKAELARVTEQADKRVAASVEGFKGIHDFLNEQLRTMSAFVRSALEIRAGVTQGDRRLADLQDRLLGTYEEYINNKNGGNVEPGMLQQLEHGIATISAIANGVSKLKGIAGSVTDTSIVPAPLPGQPGYKAP